MQERKLETGEVRKGARRQSLLDRDAEDIGQDREITTVLWEWSQYMRTSREVVRHVRDMLGW